MVPKHRPDLPRGPASDSASASLKNRRAFRPVAYRPSRDRPRGWSWTEDGEGVLSAARQARTLEYRSRLRLGSKVVKQEVGQGLRASFGRLDFEPGEAGDNVDPQFPATLMDNLRVFRVVEVSPTILDRLA
jgi:hypothetical protein